MPSAHPVHRELGESCDALTAAPRCICSPHSTKPQHPQDTFASQLPDKFASEHDSIVTLYCMQGIVSYNAIVEVAGIMNRNNRSTCDGTMPDDTMVMFEWVPSEGGSLHGHCLCVCVGACVIAIDTMCCAAPTQHQWPPGTYLGVKEGDWFIKPGVEHGQTLGHFAVTRCGQTHQFHSLTEWTFWCIRALRRLLNCEGTGTEAKDLSFELSWVGDVITNIFRHTWTLQQRR